MDRRDKILSKIQKDRPGLEIGPSYGPVAPRRDGFNVKIIDHASASALQKKYLGHPGVNVAAIEEVDFVWSGEPFKALVGEDNVFDWVIASHVIEHTPDLIGFLNDCASVLSNGGILALAVPDKRYCFDYFRERSSLARLIDAHAEKRKRHTVGTAAEHMLHVVQKSGHIAWGTQDPVTDLSQLNAVHVREDVLKFIELAKSDSSYLDFHNWVFTPHYFRLIMRDLRDLGYTEFCEVEFHESDGCEFIITLSKDASAPLPDRRALVLCAKNELVAL